MERAIAFLADGVVHVLEPGRPPRRLESAFALEVKSRAQEIHRRHAWKSDGRGAMFMSRGLLWGPAGGDPAALRVRVTSLAGGPGPGVLTYALAAEGRTAVCRLRLADGVERRLLHGSERELTDLSVSPDGEELACSVQHRDGSASLAVMTADATDLVEVTEGEVRDAAPAWAPPGRRLAYESAGVGRDGKGRFAGLGPSAIHVLDLAGGCVEDVAAEPGRSLVRPRFTADGALLYVVRPYSVLDRGSPLRLALDLVLLPLRLLYAVFQYLSFFTARYTGRPLTTAGGPRRKGADVRRMQVWSNLLEAEEDAREGDEPPPSAPRSWQLLRRRPDGATELLAEAVVSYDVDSDGVIVYSTGNAVHLLGPDGRRTRVLSQPRVQQVVFVPGPPASGGGVVYPAEGGPDAI
jgi:hypothetical protein